MNNKEKQFIRELDVIRKEANAGAQFLYAYLSINSILGDSPRALSAVNNTPLFWNTVTGALQTSFFIVLGRIFDESSKHNINTLLRAAQDNIDIFSKKALARRKREGSGSNADEWIEDYLKKAYVPTAEDFRKLKKKINEYRKIYKSNYRDIRHKVYAHTGSSDPDELKRLFSKTNIRELEKVFTFTIVLHDLFWELLHNGRKPVLRRIRYSVKSMRKYRKPEWKSDEVHERMVKEVTELLRTIATAEVDK